MFKKLAKQLKASNDENSCFPMSSPINSFKEETKTTFFEDPDDHDVDLLLFADCVYDCLFF